MNECAKNFRTWLNYSQLKMTLAIKQTKLTSFIHPFVFVFRETRVLNHSAPVQPLVFIICCEVPPNAGCTGFMTTTETVTQLTVILHLSLVLHGHWWCHGVLPIACFTRFAVFLSSTTHHWTRISWTGMYTAWIWSELNPLRLTLPTGEQHATTRPSASISETTSEATSKTLTFLILWVLARARRLTTSTSGDIGASISRHLSGRLYINGVFTLTVAWAPAVTLRPRGLVRFPVRTTLATMGSSTPSSAAHRVPARPPSGGLELISNHYRGETATAEVTGLKHCSSMIENRIL